jgi:hypothetical protein
MVRAFGALFVFPMEIVAISGTHWRAEGPIHTSLGQRPRNRKAQDYQGLKARSICLAGSLFSEQSNNEE